MNNLERDFYYFLNQPDDEPEVGPLPVIMLDEPLHTDEHPYCDDMTCPCHTDHYQS